MQCDSLLRPGLPLGMVGRPGARHAQLALRRPARSGDFVMIGLTETAAAVRAPRLHRRAPGARVPHPSAGAGCRSPPPRASARTPRGRCAASSSPPAASPPTASGRSSARCSSPSSRARSTLDEPAGIQEAIAWVPGIDADAIVAASVEPETEELFAADRDAGPHRRRRPDRVPGPVGDHARRRGPLHRAERRSSPPTTARRSRSAASSRSRPTTSRSPTSTAASRAASRPRTPPRSSPRSRTA